MRRQNADIEVIVGRNSILEALRARRNFHKILLAKGLKGNNVRDIILLAKDNGVFIQYTNKQEVDSISKVSSNQGVVALVEGYNYFSVNDILALATRRGEDPFILIADEIKDPHNLGSLIRSSEAAGVHGIVITRHHSVGLTPTVSKVSAGASEHLMVSQVTNLSSTIEVLKKAGLWVVGTDAGARELCYDIDLNIALALVVGSEERGIRRSIKDKCDHLVSAPIYGKISSLNVAVAAALIMYEAVRQKKRLGIAPK